MNVGMWMSRNPLTVKMQTPVTDAARLMAERQVRRLLVAEPWPDGPRLLGIITAKDVIHAFPPNVNPFAIAGPDASVSATTAGDIMTARPLTTTPDAPIEEVAAMMRSHKIGAVPVLREKTLVGIITESDIFRAFVSLFHSEDKGARITFDARKSEDVFALMGKLSKRYHLKISSLIWTMHDEIPACVIRVAGDEVDAMLDELWRSGHPVLNVLRFEGAENKTIEPTAAEGIQPPRPTKKISGSMYLTG